MTLQLVPGCANRFYDFYFFVKPLVPLRVGKCILSECVETKFLVVNGYKSILVLRLAQDILFNKLIQGHWIVGIANHFLFYVLLHFILHQLCALSKN